VALRSGSYAAAAIKAVRPISCQAAYQLLDRQIGWQPLGLMGAAHQLQDLGRSGRPLGAVANGAALEEQDRLQTVRPGGRRSLQR
jgi:hypothetical protein